MNTYFCDDNGWTIKIPKILSYTYQSRKKSTFFLLNWSLIPFFHANKSNQLTLRPSDCRQITTEFRFWRSHRSTLWKVSWVGTPKFLAHSRKAEMFSMHLKAILLSLTFLMDPGCRALASLHRITPSLSTSKKLSVSPDVLMGSAVTALIHSRDSWASSSLYLELI